MRQGADWPESVRALLEALSASDVTEFRYTRHGLRLRLRRQPGTSPAPTAAAPEPADDALHVTRAPLTGVFYRAPSPEAAPYAVEGEWLEAGRVVGLIEAMKVFNEVQIEVAGRLVRWLVEAGQLVQQGAPLLQLDPRAVEESA